jgi:hypothetical protein
MTRVPFKNEFKFETETETFLFRLFLGSPQLSFHLITIASITAVLWNNLLLLNALDERWALWLDQYFDQSIPFPWPLWPRLCKSESIIRMITLSVTKITAASTSFVFQGKGQAF